MLVMAVALSVAGISQKANTPEFDKKLAADLLTRSLVELETTVKGLSMEELTYIPEDGGWSVLNCLEHIAVTEPVLLGQIQGVIEQNVLNPKKDLSAEDGLIITYVTDRTKKVVTPEPFRPSEKNQNKTKEEFLEEIRKNRKAVLDFLQSTDADLRHLFAPYPYGEADMVQQFLIIGAHSFRHTMQITEIIEESRGTELESKKIVAKKYFKAFHRGDLEEVYSYLSEDCVVQYGTEEPKEAKLFFVDSAPLIATLAFETHGVYSSENTDNVLIEFSFTVPERNGSPAVTTEAVDIIQFDENNKIVKIKVVPNS